MKVSVRVNKSDRLLDKTKPMYYLAPKVMKHVTNYINTTAERIDHGDEVELIVDLSAFVIETTETDSEDQDAVVS